MLQHMERITVVKITCYAMIIIQMESQTKGVISVIVIHKFQTPIHNTGETLAVSINTFVQRLDSSTYIKITRTKVTL